MLHVYFIIGLLCVLFLFLWNGDWSLTEGLEPNETSVSPGPALEQPKTADAPPAPAADKPPPPPPPAPPAPKTAKERALAKKQAARAIGQKGKQAADTTSSAQKQAEQAKKQASNKIKKEAGDADIQAAGERIEVAKDKIGVGASKLEKAKRRTKPEGFRRLGNDFVLPLEPYSHTYSFAVA